MYNLKRYSQNFLIDNNIINKIINEFNPVKNDTVIEIGPGRGALTKTLSERTGKLAAVEIDKNLSEKLKSHFPEIIIINEDFLKFNFSEHFNQGLKIRLIGNIPYNITTSLLLKIIYEREWISDALLMVQLDLAERILSPRGSKKYRMINLLISIFTELKICFNVSPSSFVPRPRINSAVINLNIKQLKHTDINEMLLIKIIKAAFANKRKTLKNSLQNSIFKNYDFSKFDFDFSRRAEELNEHDFFHLTKLIQAIKND